MNYEFSGFSKAIDTARARQQQILQTARAAAAQTSSVNHQIQNAPATSPQFSEVPGGGSPAADTSTADRQTPLEQGYIVSQSSKVPFIVMGIIIAVIGGIIFIKTRKKGKRRVRR